MPRAAEKYTKEVKDLAHLAGVTPRTVIRWREGHRVLECVRVALELATAQLARQAEPR